MNLLFGIVAIIAVGCLAGFLVALRKEEKTAGPRNIHVYIAQERRRGLHKVAARSYSAFTVIDGGSAAGASAAAHGRAKIAPLKTPDALRQGSGYSQGA